MILLWIGMFFTCFQYGEGQAVLANTALGQVMGVKMTVVGFAGSVLTRFAGIPYAEPPTGQLRFAKPVPKSPWDGVLNATAYGPKCPQPASPPNAFDPNTGMDEDCLTLNVYSPRIISYYLGPLPVMVYIHGGGFTVGEGALYDGMFLALQGGVVVVNFNYRLGALGFLSTSDDSAPGNYGLWDQRLAIQWVKDNIGNFGGDPDKITIFGESAGGWSVTYQMASPLNNKTLFQRVIAQSGVAFSGIVISGDLAKFKAWNVASSVGCTLPYGSSTRTLISCLRRVSVDDLLSQTALTASATIDGEFLPLDIDSLLAHPRIGQYDLLFGVNSQEGSAFLTPNTSSLTSQALREAIQGIISLTCQCKNPQDVTDAIQAWYFGTDKLDNPRENVVKFTDVIGDLYFDVASANFRDRHAAASTNTKTYFYYFTYETGKEFLLPPGISDWLPGAPHALEIMYIFGAINVLYPNNTETATLSANMIEYWGAFAWNGDPNREGLPWWPEFEAENKTYAILDASISTGKDFKAERLAFWNDYIPAITESLAISNCSYEVPLKSGTRRKSDTKTVEILGKDGGMLGSVVGALRVADEAMGGQEIAEFLGIPYAKPPLGDLRFRPPQDTGPWGDDPLGIPENPPPACPQDVTQEPWMVRLGFNRTSEDCLTLNIYAPATETSGSAKPVLVFIHPGRGSYGSSSVYNGVQLASQADAVLVFVNHRLGALGFLSTEDDAAPGNYGLHDILAALKWVNKYIGSFGGDSDRVTVAGQGSGSVLAHLLVVSVKAEGLFQRVMLMSASSITSAVDNRAQPRASDRAKTLGAAVGCPTADSNELISCLRQTPVVDLLSNTVILPFGVAFPIVVDGTLVPDKPINLLRAGKINDVEVVIGLSRDEDAAVAFGLLGLECPTVEEVQQTIRLVSGLSFKNPDVVSLALNAEYLEKGGLADDCKPRGGFRKFLNDYLSDWSTVEAARLHAAAGQSVYYYIFDHKPQSHYTGLLPPQAGASMGDEMQFLFGDPFSSYSDDLLLAYRLQDKRMTLELMTFFKNFMHTGAPGTSLSGVEWPAFDSDNLGYMSLTDCPRALSGHDLTWDHLHRFWVDLMWTLTAETRQTMSTPQTTSTQPSAPMSTPAAMICKVGQRIGLNMSPEAASTLIGALIGVTVGALVLAVSFFVGCMVHRSRAIRIENERDKQKLAGSGNVHFDKGESNTRL